MKRRISNTLALSLAVASLATIACEAGGIGDPCVPEDEYKQGFSGFSPGEVNVETRSFQCETRVCLAAYFQGRVSCPYGNALATNNSHAPAQGCLIPGTTASDQNSAITVPVNPQLQDRRPEEAVYCSCRCDGPDPNANYCECPSGFRCEELVNTFGLGNRQQAGSYCIKDGTQVADPQSLETGERCREPSCGPVNPYAP